MSMENNELRINMLGCFTIEYNGEIVLANEGKVPKIWNFLGFLIANRKKCITSYDLIDLLCANEKSSDPANVVKNIAYRARKMLGDSELPKFEYIQKSGGAYRWNNMIPISIDAEEFLEKCNRARLETDKEKAITVLEEAIDLYRGKFLPRSQYDEWANRAAVFYHRQYVDAIIRLYTIQKEKKCYSAMLPICEKAIQIELYDEDIYMIYIYCLAMLVRRHIVGGANRTLISVLSPLRLCRTGTCRRLLTE